MKTQNQVRITNENVRITENNVQHISECIAMSAIKKMMRFAHHPCSLDKLYAGLVEDIYGNRGYHPGKRPDRSVGILLRRAIPEDPSRSEGEPLEGQLCRR